MFLHLFNQKYSNIVNYYNFIFKYVKMLFYSCDGKTELLAVQIYSIYLRLVL